jgi:hypothetical protein
MMSISLVMRLRTTLFNNTYKTKKLLGLVGDVTQMLRLGGPIKGIMPLVMHRYVQITSLLIPCTPLCISVGSMYKN